MNNPDISRIVLRETQCVALLHLCERALYDMTDGETMLAEIRDARDRLVEARENAADHAMKAASAEDRLRGQGVNREQERMDAIAWTVRGCCK